MIRALINIIGDKEGDRTLSTHFDSKKHSQQLRSSENGYKSATPQHTTILDPFSGGGTTALESQLLGINFVGLDISPLCVIQGKVKTESIYVIDEIEKIKNEVLSSVSNGLANTDEGYYKLLDKLTNNEKIKNFYTLALLLAVSDKSRRNRDFVNSFVKNVNLMIASVKDYLDKRKVKPKTW